jgi:EAL domain-containing protein (putative c-di-GMP-specific phosphodiesterase class I)
MSRTLNLTSTEADHDRVHERRAVGKRPSYVPLCFVVDEEPSVRHFLSLILHGHGIDAEEFVGSAALRRAMRHNHPDIVFLDIGIESVNAADTVAALGDMGYSGFVQLMSRRGAAVLAHVKSIGEQRRLRMLPVLKKPFETSSIVAILKSLRLGHSTPKAGQVSLDEALRNGWIEFWHQPKIDLKAKRLVGVESFARARHPRYGVLPPAAFMPSATNADLIELSELALASALEASASLSGLGIHLRFAVNIPVDALVKLPIADIVRMHCERVERWPGLIIDITEEQIVTDLALAADMARRLAHMNVKLAIDDFGRGYSSFARLKELPFAELKLDRTLVADCGTDRVNAPLCKTVIELAHNFGSTAVAIGIEKAADAIALTRMGCDIGQGFLLGQPMAEGRLMSLLRQRANSQTAAAAGPRQIALLDS